ncbi:GWT1-domain-containing protein [Cokeromyces recurvatus]|uniref:GWT1-domain-containing protein n=1 Tax=Cokeromyces recurvatus TaxID=90255 RepID=UPI00221F5FF9|nr:GWT1-domain-containing protein [Cokeromyces recurvatus]KAI7904723.1 GWT1-domain-containing protein [Cokeromyces recurvatus]
MEISEEDYKLAKEAHVSNCTGGSIQEINIICASIIGSHMLWTSLVHSNVIQKDSFMPEFIIYIIPVLACLTVASDYASWITTGMVTMALFLQSSIKSKPTIGGEYKPYLTVYRAGTMILTCIAILAVDFQFFPRRFAKVETFGTSLMDLGVGSFVFSSGVVASRAYASFSKVGHNLMKSFRSAFPILVLGFARLFLTKSVNYQEHSSEYGLHWNFFFTLGFLPPFVTLISSLRTRWLSFSWLGFLVACGYQTALIKFGLQEWILNAPRVNLLSANKEGICSSMGYLSIFLFGLECGNLIFSTSNNTWLSRIIKDKNYLLLARLVTYSFIMWTIFGIWDYSFPQLYVSRRLANLPYVLWVVAFNFSFLSLLVLIEHKMGVTERGPPMLDSVNMNGLFTFLLANVLTGIINLTIRTLYVDVFFSSLINIFYMLIVVFIPWLLWKHYKIRIKFSS